MKEKRQISLSSFENRLSVSADSDENQNGANGEGAASYTFVQNNYSPKSLSRMDIYRDTKNMFAQAKGALGS